MDRLIQRVSSNSIPQKKQDKNFRNTVIYTGNYIEYAPKKKTLQKIDAQFPKHAIQLPTPESRSLSETFNKITLHKHV